MQRNMCVKLRVPDTAYCFLEMGNKREEWTSTSDYYFQFFSMSIDKVTQNRIPVQNLWCLDNFPFSKRDFIKKNPASSLFIIYQCLTPCQISEKSLLTVSVNYQLPTIPTLNFN